MIAFGLYNQVTVFYWFHFLVYDIKHSCEVYNSQIQFTIHTKTIRVNR